MNKVARVGFQSPHWTGSPVIVTPGPLATSLYASANTLVTNSNVQSGTLVTLQSNVLTGNVMWIESGLPIASTNVSYGLEVGPLHQFKLILNGTDRFVPQFGKYFNQYQPYVYNSGSPYPGIYVYSFAVKPEDLQPSGTCNFSRIDQAQAAVYLKTGMPTTLLQQMFAVNYNILKIASGMGGIVFSN